MAVYMLFQIADGGDFFYNSSNEPAALIAAGKELAAQYPVTDYVVKCGDAVVWSSEENAPGNEAGGA